MTVSVSDAACTVSLTYHVTYPSTDTFTGAGFGATALTKL
jgi:hypothetical protein